MSPASNSQYTLVQSFLDTLKNSFSGEIETTLSERLIAATDNSIYQVLPIAVLYPKNNTDIDQVMRLISEETYRTLSITAKGGATGTNGQSLTNGIVLDLSRHMNQILEFDASKQKVRVQAGVVKDQLNAYLKPHGFFFAPELSTSNRATIGGMINTDASGQGSVTYGKTRHHVISLKTILLGGIYLNTQSQTKDALKSAMTTAPDQFDHQIYNALDEQLSPYKKAVEKGFPKLNRSVTGYDLYHYLVDNEVNLNHLLCGSEGTLGIITEATLNVLPIPKFTALVVISYSNFIEGLRDAPFLMKAPVTPTSIEIMDDRVIALAQNDYIWASTQHYFKDIDYTKFKGLQLIEFNADNIAALNDDIEQFIAYCAGSENTYRLSLFPVIGKKAVTDIYALRKRSVGLLGNIKGERRPLPFVEDTAVPPEHLADYIVEFRAILDHYQLTYGMFGHSDAGVLHVRPALDLKSSNDQALIRPITDQVFELCQKYGGVLWGEHGKGVRSEYAKEFFGALYPVIQSVKTLFDPYNQLNPGKIATATNTDLHLSKIDDVSLRGSFDGEINHELWQNYQKIVFCNGNGACFNYDLNSAMCPSYKATRDRVQSPKGRAVLIKEWLRQSALNKKNDAFEAEVFQSLQTCLSCQSCTGECPVKVNIPDARAKFLNEYYKTNKRPLRDYLLSCSESMAPLLYKIKALYNPIAKTKINQALLRKIGLVDTPAPQENGLKQLINEGLVTPITPANIAKLKQLTDKERAHSIIIVPDAFSRFFDNKTLAATIRLLAQLKIKVYIAPYKNSGKAYHVLGMVDAFEKAAKVQATLLKALASANIDFIGIEPPVTLLYREEYTKQLSLELPDIHLLQEWLIKFIEANPDAVSLAQTKKTYQLLSHCTEKTMAPNAPQLWQKIFKAFGHELQIVSTGCCGMSGMFGHLAAQKALSQTIYEQSWKQVIDQTEDKSSLLATGYSCRSQVKRFSAETIDHPVIALLQLMDQ